MTTVLTVGVFDMLHIGHIQLFRHARRLGDRLVVAVQESSAVLRYKPQEKLVYSTEERMFMVKALKYVSDVVEYTDVDLLVQDVPFDILAVGPDQTHEGFRRAIDYCRSHNKQVVTIPRTEGISTSWLKEQIKHL